MNARDVMTSPVISATANAPVRDIAQLLLKNHISAVPILDYSGAPIDMWLARATSSADGTRSASGGSRCWRKTNRSAPISFPDYVAPSASRSGSCQSRSSPSAARTRMQPRSRVCLFTTHRIKRVPVVRDGRVVGIVSQKDLLRWMANEAHPRRQA